MSWLERFFCFIGLHSWPDAIHLQCGNYEGEWLDGKTRLRIYCKRCRKTVREDDKW